MVNCLLHEGFMDSMLLRVAFRSSLCGTLFLKATCMEEPEAVFVYSGNM